MMAMRINWKEVKHRMVERDVPSMSQLAKGAKLHPNTLYKNGAFVSTTVDSLANFLGCQPLDLIVLVDAPEEGNSHTN
jgi:hypothetical protein